MLSTPYPFKHRDVVATNYIHDEILSGEEEVNSFAYFMPNLKHLQMHFSKLFPKGLKVLMN
jgi:hypothetical protein